jgi:hypothetical protein
MKAVRASKTLANDTVRTFETSDYSETTRRYIPEGSHLYTCRRENLKSHMNNNFQPN